MKMIFVLIRFVCVCVRARTRVCICVRARACVSIYWSQESVMKKCVKTVKNERLAIQRRKKLFVRTKNTGSVKELLVVVILLTDWKRERTG